MLSGGGAKGAYQIGVYKAIRKMNIKIDIITGTSIGSINGAVLAAGDYRKAKRFWLNVDTFTIFGYSFNRPSDFPKIAKEYIANKGLKFDKAEAILDKVINEHRIRRSRIDYGLVTVNLKTRVPKMLTKSQIPNGKLISYVMASAACFPALSTKKIDGEHYIDGGYYDNLPINLAIDMGADEVIAVDLRALGLKDKKLSKDIKVDYIVTNDKRLFSIDFDPDSSRYTMNIGYNDTMKYFGKLEGNIYTFKKGNLESNYKKLNKYYIDLIKVFLLNDDKESSLAGIIKNRRYKKILLNIKNEESIINDVNSSLEYLGSIFDIDKDKIYNINRFNKKLLEKVKELNYISLDKNLKGKMLIGYIYNRYMKNPEDEEIHKKLFNIALVFPKDFLAALYLIVISERYPLKLKSDNFYNKILNSLKK